MDYMLFDADNHYYEAEDAFTRYGDEDVKRYVRWVSEGKRRHIVFGGPPEHRRAEPHVQPDRDAGRVPRAPEGAAGGQGRAQPQRLRHPTVRRARAAPRGLPATATRAST